MWQKSITSPNSLDQVVSKQLCSRPSQVYLDEHPFADPPVFEPPTLVDESLPKPEEEQVVVVEVEKSMQDYTARDWVNYFKNVSPVYWIIFGAVLLLPICVATVYCCWSRRNRREEEAPIQ